MTGMTGAGMTGAGMTGAGMTGTHGTHGMTGPSSAAHPSEITTFNGSIDITISDAKLFETQHGSKQDPYCVVALGSGGLKSMMEGQHLMKEKFQTKVHNGAGQHPIWNETHSLSLKNMKLDTDMEVRIYDKDTLKDDYIGLGRITLGELIRFDKKGVQYLPVHKKGALGQTKSEQIGQVGVGVVFNCTEMPQQQADLKSQATDTLVRKDQQISGVNEHSQTAQTAYTHPIQPTDQTKSTHTQGTIKGQGQGQQGTIKGQGQGQGQISEGAHGQQYM
jgi:hypothetical protein